jgi:hypothetical protein
MTTAACNPDRPWHVCCHEAGHAVAYLAMGEGVRVVEIAVDDEGSGHCRVRRWGDRSAAACLSGYCAETRVTFGPSWHPTTCDMQANLHLRDFQHAVDALGSDDPDALLAAWNEAAAIVGEHWDVVEIIADALR